MTRNVGHPTVLLRHDLPDGSSHVDWMLGQDAAGEAPLVTFRLDERVDRMVAGGPPITAERIGDHRPVYLDYEGPIAPREPGGPSRGRVTRLARGTIEAWTRDHDDRVWSIDVLWTTNGAPARQRLVARHRADAQWTIETLAWTT